MPLSIETLLSLLVNSSLRITVVATVTALILIALRIRSNACRHLVWSSILCCMFLMPLLLHWIPPITFSGTQQIVPLEVLTSYMPAVGSLSIIPEPTHRVEGRTDLAVPGSVSAPVYAPSWPALICAIYLLGVTYFALRLVLGWRVMRKLRRTLTHITLSEFAHAYESTFVWTPITIGVLHPRIVLPSEWRSWSAKKLHAILVHESTHIFRRDGLKNFIANLNAVVYWFHPLAWWLRAQVAVTSEFACDDAAVRAIGGRNEYAEILVNAADAVRRNKGRLWVHALGVHGRGMLKDRIERVLKNGELHPITATRKLLLSSTLAAIIVAAVACRNESVSLPALGDLRVEEPRAAAKVAAELSNGREWITRRDAQQAAIKAAQSMSSTEVAQLESGVARNPEDVEARTRLLYFYGRDSKVALSKQLIADRRRHVVWLIEHHPGEDILSTWCVRLSPLPSAHLSDPEGYAEARTRWLEKTASPAASLAVLANAAYFFEVADKPLSEKLLLRIQAAQPDVRWSVRLGRLYALTIMGAIDATTMPGINDRQPQGLGLFATSESEANGEFSQSVRTKLAQSKDPELLNAVAVDLNISQFLLLRPETVIEMATTYLRRAVDINPHFVPAHEALLRIVFRKKQSETQAVLRKLPVESRFTAVLSLPETQRFPAMREMAEHLYQEGNSLDILDAEKADTDRDLSRRYAEELLKLAPRFRSDPGYSGAVFSADIIGGLVAARKGDGETALKYLRDASMVPSSEEMAYLPPFVPYDRLTTILGGSGQRDAVIAFYEHFAQINLSRRDYLLQQAMELRRKKQS